MGKGDTLLNAVIGAVVTIVLSFTGISPVLGGAVAGYLQQGTRRAGARVGGISGAIAFLPFVGVLVLGFGFFLTGLATGGFGVPGGVELLVVLLVVVPFLLFWNVGLGAVGGYLGTYLREEFSSPSGRAVEP